MDANSYASQLRQLLPRGSVFKTDPDSNLAKVMLALADELARVDARAVDLLEEFDPRTATETLSEWERVLGLPDSCLTEIPATVADRRLAITQKLVTRGGQTAQFYIDLAANFGYAITIDTYTVCRSGLARSGDRCYTDAWAYAWLVHLPIEESQSGAHVGNNVGAYLGSSNPFGIECVIQRAAPAHTIVLFDYL